MLNFWEFNLTNVTKKISLYNKFYNLSTIRNEKVDFSRHGFPSRQGFQLRTLNYEKENQNNSMHYSNDKIYRKIPVHIEKTIYRI